MLKFSMLLQAIDRVSGPARRINAAVDGMTRKVRESARAAASAAAPARRLERVNQALAGGFAAAGRAAKRWAGRAGIGSWGDAAEKAGHATGRLLKKVAGLGLTAAKWAGGAAIAGSGFALFDMFKTASQFEQFEIMLENMEGSAAGAKRAMAWVQQFAEKTPYELADVMEAFVALKAYGIDPTNGSLTALGDAAAGMSKPVGQAVEALADAITGEFERLKEFGIRASKEGDKVAFTYRKNGKDIRREVNATGSEIEKALTGIFSDRFGGMMDRQSKTLSGMLSNLKDQWSKFQMMVAEAGIFDVVKNKVTGILERVNAMAKDGSLKRWAEGVSGGLERMVAWGQRFVNDTDWGQVASDLRALANAVGAVANGLANAARWAQLLGKALSFNPASGLERWIDRNVWGIGGQSKPGSAGGLKVERSGTLRNGDFGRRLLDAQQRRNNSSFSKSSRWRDQQQLNLGAPRPRPAVGRKVSQQDVNVGGKLQIDVRAAGGASARVRSASATDARVPLMVQLGRSMGGPA